MEPLEAKLDAETLLAQVDWVHALARSLVGDPSRADDVSQETWLAALRHPPPAGGSLRAWLGRVARNVVRPENRREAVRRGHEARAARPDALPSTGELVERVAVQRAVVDAVLALDEPYRRTILLRYFEGLAPQAIARETRTPVSTVKTRLARGLAHLRRRLDEAHGGDGRAWLSALAPLVPHSGWKGALGAGAWIVGTKTIVGVAAAAAALVLAGWWLTRPGDTLRTPEPVVAGEHALVPAEPVAPETAPPEAVPGGERAVLAPEIPPTGALRVVVVDAETGARVPGATLRYASYETWRNYREAQEPKETADVEECLKTSGLSVPCDGNGEWIAPDAGMAGVFCARSGDRWAFALRPAGDELVLELEVDRAISIEVVDSLGRPAAGVPIEVRTARPEGGGNHWDGRTDASGRLALRHIDEQLPSLAEGGYRVGVSLEVPMEPPQEVVLDPGDLPEAPIRFVLPATGSLRVDAHDEEGRPVAAWIYVTPLVEDAASPGRPRRGERREMRTQDGVALFPYVALGLRLKVDVDPDRRTLHAGDARVLAGPATAGETVACAFEVARESQVLKGRLLGPDGAPLVRTSVSGEVLLGGGDAGDSVGFDLTTDGDGAFAAAVGSASPLTGTHDVHFETERKPFLAARREVDWSGGGAVDLLDVTLAARPVIARGHVMHSNGEPFYWAAVRVKRKVPWNNEQGFTWDNANEFMTQSEKDGSFEIVGELGAGEYAVFATKTGYLDAPLQELRAGNDDLLLVLQQEGQIAGSVRLDEGVEPTWLRVTAEPRLEKARFSFDPDPDYVPADRLQEDARFLVSNLPPGPARVSLRFEGQPTPLAVIDDVPVAEGEVTHDPRLQDLDLRGLARRIDVDVTGPSGEPVARGHVAFDLGEDGLRHVLLDGGRASILTRLPVVDGEVLAPGFRAEQLVGLTRSTRVQLAAGIPVRIRLPRDIPLPEGGGQLRVGLVPVVESERLYDEELFTADGKKWKPWIQWEQATLPAFDEAREVTVRASAPGTQKVLWSVYTPADGFLELGSATTIEVGEAGADVELAPELDQYPWR